MSAGGRSRFTTTPFSVATPGGAGWLAGVEHMKLTMALPLLSSVTVAVVLGAASGYLLIGLAGGLLLTALWAVQPAAFNLAALPHGLAGNSIDLAVSPALIAASFTLLTTVGTNVLNTSNVAGQVVTIVITVLGQLYVAILIALIRGRFHRRHT